MGQHWLLREEPDRWCFKPNPSREWLTLYVDQVIEGLSTGAFTYLAHPDVICYTGDEEWYQKEMTRLCKEAKRMAIPLEVNMLGLVTDRPYPSERFFRIAAEVGNEIVVGCDAHSPEALSDLVGQERTLSFARALGLEPLTEVSLRKI